MQVLESIILEITQACNHACLHCYNYWSQDRQPVHSGKTLTREEIEKLFLEIQGDFTVKTVAISGGEPFLRKDLPDIVIDLISKGIGVTVITNGSLVTPETIRNFPEEVIFEITLFSTDAEIHDRIAGQPGAFRRAIDAAIAVKKQRCGLAVAIVLSRYNLQKLDRTVELALAIGADGLLLNRINLSSTNYPLRRQLVPGLAEFREALYTADKTAGKYGIKIALSVPVPPCLAEPEEFPNLHFGWCPRGGPNSYFTIGYDGLVRPCNHSSMILGDLRKQPFREIIRSEKPQVLWSAFPPECQVCLHPLRDECRGGCPAASYECYGTAEKTDPFVEGLLSPENYDPIP